MARLVLLVGPPGSGKSTLAKKYEAEGFVRISQDDQGKGGHIEAFRQAVNDRKDIIVDRMNFNIEQRKNYMVQVAHLDYEIEIIVLHQPYDVCLERILKREGHPTIQDEKSARSALQTFFTKYERPYENPRFKLTFVYPEGPKPRAIICDLDGTLCNVEHRRHFVRLTDEEIASGKKKNWPAFFGGIKDDTVNQWCALILRAMQNDACIVYCSGRSDNERKSTVEWLEKYKLDSFGTPYTFGKVKAPLYMRNRHDSRRDDIVKEIILDFEILTRYTPQFMIDDRKQVVEMWRKRGFVCLQCDEGDF
ncbi:MAG: AAA family ATPase [Leptolyngbyaceae cyanobacterium RM2_2_4]|nr:AAA family ATPase [Leptolyngbyaceae cyanobacterium RM2_2_4]